MQQQQPGKLHTHVSVPYWSPDIWLGPELLRDVQFGLPAWPKVGVATQKFAGANPPSEFLNPPLEYGAPTGSSARDRASTKTHFESRLHIDLAMFTNHTWHGIPCRSVSVSNLLWARARASMRTTLHSLVTSPRAPPGENIILQCYNI